MPQKIRMWEVTPENTLAEVTTSGISLEERLEDWLESDISMLDPDLMVIGRQVRIPSVGTIDLLCLDADGDLVVIELKRGQTPREVTTQALDYASWVEDLGFEQIQDIASSYGQIEGGLEESFEAKFNQQLPEVLNLNHRSLIVAESMDDSTERIVRYLSDFGVPINIATVQHFRGRDGREMLAQVFMVEPEVAAAKAQSGSKRPTMTVHQLNAMAEANGVGELYARFNSNIPSSMSPAAQTPGRRALRVDIVDVDGNGRWVAVFFVEVRRSSAENGLNFRLNGIRLMNRFGITREQVESILPENRAQMDSTNWRQTTEEEIADWVGYQGYFRTVEEVDRFIAGLREAIQQSPG